MSFINDLLKHIEEEDRKPKPYYNRPDDFQERMLRTLPRSQPREERLNQKLSREIERQDRIKKPLNNIPEYQGDIEELIKNLELELKGNPNAFYIKKRKTSRRGSKRRTSKRKTSRRRK